jgi:L-asparaginase
MSSSSALITLYGRTALVARHRLMLCAVHSGLPVVRVGRGNTEGFVPLHDPDFIGGSNLTATKARLLLMACLMKFGSLPAAADPDHPTPAETAAIREKVAAYQASLQHSLICRRPFGGKLHIQFRLGLPITSQIL